MSNISIIMRSKDDEWVIGETLEMVARQSRQDFELVNIDSGSTDGTLDIIRRYNPEPLSIRPDQYIPGWVLNMGVRAASNDILVFLNSDCTPVDERWLENLVAPLEGDAATVYSRQVARPDAHPLVRRDYEVAFPRESVTTREAILGDGSWHNFFSMASSATKRSVWEQFPFDDEIQYSEDIFWSRTLRQNGLKVFYEPSSQVYHSHNYTFRQAFKRFRGEGKADARIFEDGGGVRESFPFYVAMPFLSAVVHDAAYCIPRGHFGALMESVPLRASQKLGRYVGLREGRKEVSR
jgi:rhamnosyltransferase